MLTFLNRTGEQLSVLWRDVYENVLNPKPDTGTTPGSRRKLATGLR